MALGPPLQLRGNPGRLGRPMRIASLLTAIALGSGVAGQSTPTVRNASNPEIERRSALRLARLWNDATDRSVERGLAWLASQQQDGGSWAGDVGHKRGDSYLRFDLATTQRAEKRGHVGVSALAGMAFLSGGHLPNRGKYGAVIQKTVDYLLGQVQSSGLIADSGTRMYSHAFATLFLAEVYGTSRNRKIKKGLERAVHIIVDCQNQHGAWRYNAFTQAADLSVTVCQLQALRAARNIGIEVPRTTVDSAVRYVKASQTTRGRGTGLFFYKIHGAGAYRKNQQFAINAAGVTALTSAGVYDQELIGPAVDFLAEEWSYVRRGYAHHYYFWYGNYYASQALFHADAVIRPGCFHRYYARMRDHLLDDQRADGRWPNSTGPGDVFSTAVACIVLQIPKQYLPIFQR